MEQREFEEFWKSYPRRVGKLVAMKAFEKARRIASQTEILAGVVAYIQNKPDYADFAHPSSWLAAGRWMDEWDAPVSKSREPQWNGEDWYQECKREHGGACELDRFRHINRMQQEKAS